MIKNSSKELKISVELIGLEVIELYEEDLFEKEEFLDYFLNNSCTKRTVKILHKGKTGGKNYIVGILETEFIDEEACREK